MLKELSEANLHVSIVVSGLLEQTAECCHKSGLEPHTVEFSMGIWGKRELLPPDEVLKITTMCGHGMISFNLVKDIVGRIKDGKMSPEKAANKLAGLCHCGVFNPERAIKVFEMMREL